MSNGSEVAEKTTNKMSEIGKNIDHLREACAKNLELSSEIRSKLLCSETKKGDESAKVPRGPGALNNVIDSLQEIINTVIATHAHLISVNKDI